MNQTKDSLALLANLLITQLFYSSYYVFLSFLLYISILFELIIFLFSFLVSSTAGESTKPTKAAAAGKATKPVAAATTSLNDDVDWGDDDLDDEEFFKIDVDLKTSASSPKDTPSVAATVDKAVNSAVKEAAEKDNSFREYRKLCAEIAEESSYNGKTAILSQFLQKGSTGGKAIIE